MILDALKYLVELGQKTAAPHVVALPGGRLLTCWGNDCEVTPEDSEPINDLLTTLSDLEQWLLDYGTDDADPVVFVGEKRVKAMTYREIPHLRSTASVGLDYSQAWIALDAACRAPGLKQDVFVRALRGPLAGCIDPKWLAVFRRINFTRSNATDRGIGHAGEKLGRSVEKLAQSADGEIPEQLAISLPVFQLSEISKQMVRCAVEVDADAEMIRLIPIGDDWTEAVDNSRRQIAAWIREHKREGITVYMGNP